MIFSEWSLLRILAGEKTETRRPTSINRRSPYFWHRPLYQVGKDFAVQPGRNEAAIARAEVIGLKTCVPLGEITTAEAKREGCKSRAQFFGLWKDLHGDTRPDQRVHAFRFRLTRLELPLDEILANWPEADGHDFEVPDLRELVR